MVIEFWNFSSIHMLLSAKLGLKLVKSFIVISKKLAVKVTGVLVKLATVQNWKSLIDI